VIFLHKVVPGFADHSYGIQVAELAGLPMEVTERAKTILKNLEQTDLSMQGNRGGSPEGSGRLQMTLFEVADDELRKEISKLDLNSITPLDALRKLAELKERLKEKKS
jgi:DNA mismatch repair protein MutS